MRIINIFGVGPPSSEPRAHFSWPADYLDPVDCRTYAEYKHFAERTAVQFEETKRFETSLVMDIDHFNFAGYCVICEGRRDFLIDYQYGGVKEKRLPNWRERGVCPTCGLNSRQRAAIGMIKDKIGPKQSLYLTEQVTPLFASVKKLFPRLIGSEFLRDGTARGVVNDSSVRNEDVTDLSFPSSSFDCIGTFDVLEHVLDYKAAMREFYRCLRPGGSLVLTVPLHLSREKTVIRASVATDGTLIHHEPPEYHGDPLSVDGVLCFNDFAWDLLDDLSQIGFRDVKLSFFWSIEYVFFGGHQWVLTAQKPWTLRGAFTALTIPWH